MLTYREGGGGQQVRRLGRMRARFPTSRSGSEHGHTGHNGDVNRRNEQGLDDQETDEVGTHFDPGDRLRKDNRLQRVLVAQIVVFFWRKRFKKYAYKKKLWKWGTDETGSEGNARKKGKKERE